MPTLVLPIDLRNPCVPNVTVAATPNVSVRLVLAANI
jgi:hypothetical protein